MVFLLRFTRWNRFEGCCAFDTVRAYPVIPYYQATKKQTPKQQHDVKHVNLTSTSNASYGTCGETERASDVWRLSRLRNHRVVDILRRQLLRVSRSDRWDPTSTLCHNPAYKTSCTMVTFKQNQFGPHKMVYTQDCNPWLLSSVWLQASPTRWTSKH